ncbi:hypothetical protein BDQ17DRAFT_1383950, partial [Cyathus striatus]
MSLNVLVFFFYPSLCDFLFVRFVTSPLLPTFHPLPSPLFHQLKFYSLTALGHHHFPIPRFSHVVLNPLLLHSFRLGVHVHLIFVGTSFACSHLISSYPAFNASS